MSKLIRQFLAILLCVAYSFSGVLAYAADNVLTAEYKDKHYTLNMAIDQFFDIPELEFGQAYVKTLRFDNSSGKRIKIGMLDVYNDLEDYRIYDRSQLSIKIDEVEVYSGSMDKAQWETYVAPGDSITVEYTYSVTTPEHIPDNSWMRAEMKSVFVFVGEVAESTSGGYSGGGSNSVSIPKPTNSDSGNKNFIESYEESVPVPMPKPDVIIKIPDTGDHDPIWLCSLVMIVSGASAVILWVSGRHKKKR